MAELKCPSCGKILSVTAKGDQSAAKAATLESVKAAFPIDLASLLSFEDKGEYVKISPKQFLGSEAFAKVASVVRGIGGQYVSAGKSSHFKIPK
jgi:hypothetical protein